MNREVYRNIKNKQLYEVLYTALDTTKNRNIKSVVYRNVGMIEPVYVRDKKEFNKKFVPK